MSGVVRCTHADGAFNIELSASFMASSSSYVPVNFTNECVPASTGKSPAGSISSKVLMAVHTSSLMSEKYITRSPCVVVPKSARSLLPEKSHSGVVVVKDSSEGSAYITAPPLRWKIWQIVSVPFV